MREALLGNLSEIAAPISKIYSVPYFGHIQCLSSGLMHHEMLPKHQPELNDRLPNQQALADLLFLHRRPSPPLHLEVLLNQQLLVRQ